MENKRPPRRKKNSSDSLWNVLTLVMLLCTLCACGYFFILFRDPYSQLNFFPPDPPTASPIPPTWTPIPLPATWTPTVTVQPSPSNTKRPTITLEPSNTAFTLATATSALTATITPKPTGAPYSATISYPDINAFRSDVGCTKLLIAGRVMNAKNEPVIGLIVQMGGSLPGKSFAQKVQVLSGLFEKYYGASGFELDPGVEPVDSNGTLWVQLLSQSKDALSVPIFVTTYKDCKKNLALVTFQEK
jgi:hypothetical protein